MTSKNISFRGTYSKYSMVRSFGGSLVEINSFFPDALIFPFFSF